MVKRIIGSMCGVAILLAFFSSVGVAALSCPAPQNTASESKNDDFSNNLATTKNAPGGEDDENQKRLALNFGDKRWLVRFFTCHIHFSHTSPVKVDDIYINFSDSDWVRKFKSHVSFSQIQRELQSIASAVGAMKSQRLDENFKTKTAYQKFIFFQKLANLARKQKLLEGQIVWSIEKSVSEKSVSIRNKIEAKRTLITLLKTSKEWEDLPAKEYWLSKIPKQIAKFQKKLAETMAFAVHRKILYAVMDMWFHTFLQTFAGRKERFGANFKTFRSAIRYHVHEFLVSVFPFDDFQHKLTFDHQYELNAITFALFLFSSAESKNDARWKICLGNQFFLPASVQRCVVEFVARDPIKLRAELFQEVFIKHCVPGADGREEDLSKGERKFREHVLSRLDN